MLVPYGGKATKHIPTTVPYVGKAADDFQYGAAPCTRFPWFLVLVDVRSATVLSVEPGTVAEKSHTKIGKT